jgi:hypothetical protein
MYGPLDFIPGKLMSVFTNMDNMIGDDFQKGLANLKAAAEKEQSPATDVGASSGKGNQ